MSKVPGNWPAFFAPGAIPPAPGYRLPAGFVLSERFKVVRFLAQGGMGSVYEAEDLELRERVALKTLRAEIVEDPRLLERFRRETQLARRVTHPNVCRIYDLFRHVVDPSHASSDVVFLVMELLQGETLLSRIRGKGPLGPEEALPLVRQLAGALDAAHRAAVVHRDFKSANIILEPAHEGALRAVVTDFGVARSLEPEPGAMHPELTEAGEAIGTRDYAAPEQLLGGDVTPAADVYALGVVLYEMLTGHRPHEGDEPLAKRFERPPLPPSDLAPGVPPRWNDVILRCLEHDPAKRYPRATDVVAALSAPARRTLPLLAGIGGALLAALLVSLAVRGRGRPAPANPFPNAVQVTTSPRLDAWPAFSPDGGTLVFASERTGSFELYGQPLVAGGKEAALTADGLQNMHPVVAPDGRSVVYTSVKGGGLFSLPLDGGKPRPLTDFGARPAFSRDGALLAFQSENPPSAAGNDYGAMPPSTIWILSMKDGGLRRLTHAGDPPGGHSSPAFSPDGKWVVFTAFDPETTRLWAIPTAGGEPVPLDAGTALEFEPAVAPDGTLYFGAVTGESRGSIRRVAVDWTKARLAGPAEVVADTGALAPRHLTLSRDGTRLAYTAMGLKSNLMLMPVNGAGEPAGPPRALTTESARNSRPAFSPDGRRIAFTKWRPGVFVDVWLMDADGRNAEQFTTDPGEDTAPSWFPRGERIGFLSTRSGPAAYFAKPVAGGPPERLLDIGPDFDSPRLSPDGKRVAFNSKRGGGTINVWVADLPGGTPRQVTFDRELAGFPAWSPDGKLLAVQVRRGNDRQVGIVPADGGPLEVLTEAPGQSWSDGFSPDGARVVFAGHRDGLWNLYWVSRKTKAERQLTFQTSPNVYIRYPNWSPRGDLIVYEQAETFGNVWMLSR